MNVLAKVMLISSFIFSLADCISSQTTLHVPSQYPTIQGAIDAAHPGDPEARKDPVHISNRNYIHQQIKE